MGKRGPAPGKSKPKNQTKNNYTSGYSKPPVRMTPAAKKFWRKIVKDFPPGYHQPKHYPMLEIFCESFVIFLKARVQLSSEELTILNEKTGITKINPLLTIINAEVQKINILSSKLGFVISPDRPDADISFDVPKPTKERTVFDKLKAMKGDLKGTELSLFKKLEEKFK